MELRRWRDRRGGRAWVVLAEWLGAERVVFRGSIFECLAYERKET